MTGFVTALRDGVLVCDGAMGTMLHAAGNSLDRALPELNLSNAELVSTVHESYLAAGVDVIQTNTFGASALRLAEHGSAGPVREINLAGVRIAREAQDKAGRRVFVAGSVSPAVTARQRPLVSPAQRVAAIREQVSALAEGGVDVLILETFGYLDELAEAVTAAAELTGAPIVAQATFAPDGRTLGGETPREVAIALSRLPVVALGTNCTLGPQHTLTVVTELIRHTSLPVSAQPNAGLPRRAAGRRFEYPIDGGYFARYARRYADAGASLIGGCCGTTPTHLKAAVAAVAAPAPPARAGRGKRHGPGRKARRCPGGAGRAGGTARRRAVRGRRGDRPAGRRRRRRGRGRRCGAARTRPRHLPGLAAADRAGPPEPAEPGAAVAPAARRRRRRHDDDLGQDHHGAAGRSARGARARHADRGLRHRQPAAAGRLPQRRRNLGGRLGGAGRAAERAEPGPGQQRPDAGDQDLVPHRGPLQPRGARTPRPRWPAPGPSCARAPSS